MLDMLDMLDMFATIGTITKCDWCVATVERAQAIHSNIQDDIHFGCQRCQRDQEDVQESIEYLFDHVEEHHTPEGFYFGSIEGDASDFGVWAVEGEVSARTPSSSTAPKPTTSRCATTGPCSLRTVTFLRACQSSSYWRSGTTTTSHSTATTTAAKASLGHRATDADHVSVAPDTMP
jgi:hypothetical protein